MESNELLEQEEAYHKLNAEIELRTRQLMKNVEAVMNKQYKSKSWQPSTFEETIKNESRREHYSVNDNRSDIGLYERDFLRSPYERSQSENRKGRHIERHQKRETTKNCLIPPCAKGMSAESLSRFLKAKGKLLQEELEQTKRELQIKIDECKKAQYEIRTKEEEKLKHTGEITLLREKLKKLEKSNASLTEKLQMRDSENAILKRELDMLKQDVKKVNLSTASQETKLNKAKEEVEKLKTQLKQAELNEKEARDKYRTKNDDMVSVVRKLERQKSELETVIKKQMTMIDNLKKQKGLFEVEGALNFTEKEFLKLLERKLTDEKS